MLSAIVVTIVGMTTSSSGTPSPIAMRRNTSEASPRGPNQPMKATVGSPTCRPASARATGSIRTTVRLSTAYTTTCQVISGSASVIATAPKITQVAAARRSPALSVNTPTSVRGDPTMRPKVRPPTNAAMKPLPPRASAIASARMAATSGRICRHRPSIHPLAEARRNSAPPATPAITPASSPHPICSATLTATADGMLDSSSALATDTATRNRGTAIPSFSPLSTSSA